MQYLSPLISWLGHYRDSFSVDALYIASDGSTEPNTNCGGAQAALEPADLEAAGISRQNLSCAWQNYDGGFPKGRGGSPHGERGGLAGRGCCSAAAFVTQACRVLHRVCGAACLPG
jgi:hypothetical protein